MCNIVDRNVNWLQQLWKTVRNYHTKTSFNKFKRTGDFPGGPAVKNPPSNAGGAGLTPGQGTKVPHATGQLSLHAAIPEPAACHNY